MKIYFEKENKYKEMKLKEDVSAKKVLNKFDIVCESVILVKNGTVCLDNEVLKDKDELKILSVVSGG